MKNSSLSKYFFGKVLCWFGGKLFASNGSILYVSVDEGLTWKEILDLPISLKSRLQAQTHLSSRLFREEVYHLIPMDDNILIAFAFHNIYVCNYRDGSVISKPVAICGSAPLSVCVTPSQGLYYGEYGRNQSRKPMHIYNSEDQGRSWVQVYRMDGVRHIHGIFHDPFTNALWITTGDTNNESGIWVTNDNFKTIKRVLGGSQQTRAITLLFTNKYVYFGSDTPFEINYIYRFERFSGRIELLQRVEGSVFWGSKVCSALFFSTVVEPSTINNSLYAYLWGSLNGDEWKCITKYRKDIWPMKLFQYGQILFPFGDNTTNKLFYTPFATENDHSIQNLNLSNIFYGNL